MKNLRGKTAIVTGGAMGVGLDTTRRLLAEGVDVTIWDMNTQALEEAKATLSGTGAKLFIEQCDVSNKDQVFELALKAKETMGQVDILVNNAGIAPIGKFWEQPVEDAVKVTDVNLNAIYYTTYAFLPDMLERDSGNIVNISSSAGLVGVAELSAYCATKWAVLGFTEALRLETEAEGKMGVKLSTVHPHFIKTGLFEGGGLNFLGNLVIPRLKSHDIIAKDIVEKAIKRDYLIIKRPESLQVALLGRGLFPVSVGKALLKMSGVASGMQNVGREHHGG